MATRKPPARTRRAAPRVCEQQAPPPVAVPAGWSSAPDLPPDADSPEFAWQPWIPRGCLSLLVGLPEAGKTSLLVRLAAAITTGLNPHGEPYGSPGGVIFCAAEDSYRRTLSPRLAVAGANERLVYVPHRSEAAGTVPLRFPAGLPDLEAVIRMTAASVVILDPAAAYADSADLNNETATRGILDGLQRVAAVTACAVITTRNFNKRQTGPLLSRINGSAAWRDVPRSILCTVPHPNEPGVRVLVHAKSSLHQRSAPWRYELADRGGQPLFELVEPCTLSVGDCEDAIASAGERAELRSAHALIAGLIGDAWIRVASLYSAAQAAGISKSKLWRAKEELVIPHRRIGWGPGSYIEWGPPVTGWASELKPGGNACYLPPIESATPPPPPPKGKKRVRGGEGARCVVLWSVCKG